MGNRSHLNTEFYEPKCSCDFHLNFKIRHIQGEVDGESLRLNVNWEVIDFNLFYDGMAAKPHSMSLKRSRNNLFKAT